MLITVIAAIGILVYLADKVVSSRAYPSLGEFMASSTVGTEPGDGSQEAGGASSSTMNTIGESGASAAASPASGLRPSGSDASVPASTVPVLRFSTSIRAPAGIIHAAVAKTPDAREQGLSGQTSLAPDQGMLFIFPVPGSYGFWMKDMDIPLDMVWLRSDRTVVGISRNLSPDTYPEVFLPPSDVQFVLELNAGAAKRFGLATSSMVSF